MVKHKETRVRPGNDRHHEACGHSPTLLQDTDRKVLNRLRRIEGQIRGVEKMVEEQRYCPDVLVQISAVQESLRATAEVLLRDHLRHCVTDAVRSDDPARTEAVYDELTDLFRKYAR